MAFLFTEALFLPPGEEKVWGFILQDILPELFWNTFSLLALVLPGTLLLGGSQAFLVTYTNLPCKKIFNALFILPLSFPLYVMAFAYVGTFEMNEFFQTKGVVALAFVFIATLSPYIYLSARSAFQSAGNEMFTLGRSLGFPPLRTFFKAVLPYSAPWFFVGGSIVAMETLADFGAVSVFNYDTFTTAIYSAWGSLFSLTSAARLAGLLLLFSLFLSWFETSTFKRSRFFSPPAHPPLLLKLSPAGRPLLAFFGALPTFFSLFLPLFILSKWASALLQREGWEQTYWQALETPSPSRSRQPLSSPSWLLPPLSPPAGERS